MPYAKAGVLGCQREPLAQKEDWPTLSWPVFLYLLTLPRPEKSHTPHAGQAVHVGAVCNRDYFRFGKASWDKKTAPISCVCVTLVT